MTALEKLTIKLKPTDAYVADEFYSTFRKECPDEVFPGAIARCKMDTSEKAFHMCVKCWLQEVSE